MTDKYLEDLKRELDKILSNSDINRSKALDVITKPEEMLKFAADVQGILSTRIQQKLDPNGDDNAIDQLVHLRTNVVNYLEKSNQQELLNEYYQKILTEENRIAAQQTENIQKNARKDAKPNVVVAVALLEAEIVLLKKLKKPEPPKLTPDQEQEEQSLGSRLKVVLANSPLRVLKPVVNVVAAKLDKSEEKKAYVSIFQRALDPTAQFKDPRPDDRKG